MRLCKKCGGQVEQVLYCAECDSALHESEVREVKPLCYRLYDESEQVWVEDNDTFESIQEYLANHWIDVPDEEEDGDMYDKIMAATSWEQLEQYADGLGYSIEEGEEVK